jgi:predicted nucleotidyltransferase
MQIILDDKVVSLIFRYPEKWIHIREISRKVKVSPNSVRRILERLEKEGIIQKKKDGNMVKIRSSLDNKNYKNNKRVYNLNSVYKSGVVDFLSKNYNPKAIVLFGSYSRGEDISTSDIDIGVITKTKKRFDLNKFERRLGRRIQISLFVKDEVSKEFWNNIINGIVLEGFL